MIRSASASLIAVLSLLLISAGSAQSGPEQTPIAGTWRGNSECGVKNSACRDETNVYRFSEVATRPGWFTGVGSKIVNGSEIEMGTLDWFYDAQSRVLKSSGPQRTFQLVVDHDKMEGALLLPDGPVFRRIHLTKVK